jgi:hypothetical protein
MEGGRVASEYRTLWFYIGLTADNVRLLQVGEPWRSRRDISIEAIMYSLETASLGPRGHVALRIKLWS